VRDTIRAVLERRDTWDAAFKGFAGGASLTETGREAVRGTFSVGPDLSVMIEAVGDAARAVLQNEVSSFVTQRKPLDFDLHHAETTFVRTGTRPDGAVVIAPAGDAVATSYVVSHGELVEVGRSTGRVSYVARDRRTRRTDDGRTITVEYNVAYRSNETGREISGRAHERQLRPPRFQLGAVGPARGAHARRAAPHHPRARAHEPSHAMSHHTDATTLAAFRQEFDSLRALAERALAQVDDESFTRALDDDANSPAVLVKHVGGNLRSRWTDVFTTDGEKPDRDRDGEFELRGGDSRASIMATWESGWAALSATLASVAPADLERIVTVRGEPHTLARALTRSLAHTAGHVHQLIMLCRHWRGPAWRTLSIARGESKAFRPGTPR
jgi:hypothetical protein